MLNLIDWRMLLFSGLWISGLAVILTTVGFADYHASAASRRFREMIGRPGFQIAIQAGLMFVCFGLLGSARGVWEAVVWGLLGIGFLAESVKLWRSARTGQED